MNVEPPAEAFNRRPYVAKVNGATPAAVKLKTAADFCAEYVPLSYCIEPIIRSRSLYTLTAKTGVGKTALLVAMALGVASGRADILGAEVEKGRVAYLAFENPDDVRMRIMIAAHLLNIDLLSLAGRFLILDVRSKPEDVFKHLEGMSQVENFSLVMADTLPAWFDGKDINDNVQAGEFVRRVRPLTALPGHPSVIVAAHPTKGASDDQLVPYGGGAILNEVDGNLTLSRKTDSPTVRLHWQGKLRGLEFQPRPFRFDIVGSPDILDAKGRQVQLPVLRPMTEADEEAGEQVSTNRDVTVLKAVRDDPKGSLRDWGQASGIPKSSIERSLSRLASAHGGKLVVKELDHWRLTLAGEKALESRPR